MTIDKPTPQAADFLHEPEPGSPASCIIVLGAARGGTSMAAGLLRLMGVDMGERLDPANNEDLDFLETREPVEELAYPEHVDHEKAVKRIRALVEAKAARPGVWGWKDPLAFHYVPHVLDLIPEARFLVVFRDYYSIAARESVETGVSLAETLDRAHRNYEGILSLLEAAGRPTLIASYDKTLRRPGQFIVATGKLIGRYVDRDELRRLSAYIRPEAVSGEIDEFVASPQDKD